MCGIVGIVGAQEPGWVDDMNEIQFHRGPDDSGVYRDPTMNVSLAMRRLSIVDINDGHQPMTDESRNRVVVFNGEIFNAPELKKTLIKDKYHFNTKNSDTEVLLYLYDKYGSEMVSHLNGMFAFVIYDKEKELLFGARDRAGIKPFYYSVNSGRFVFSSEIKSILKLPFIERNINLQSVHYYLSCQFVPPPSSIFSQIMKLPAGHHFIYKIKKRKLNIHRYWSVATNLCNSSGYDNSLAQEMDSLRSLLRTCVKDWSMSDVPIGCSLSGGIDSASVVALMAEHSSSPINTWTLGFEETLKTDLDERKLARIVADRWGTIHHEIVINAGDIPNEIEKMIWHLDEPYGGGLPSWYVFKAMSGKVKVAMTGTGGDELFGNYGKWRVYKAGSTRWLLGLTKQLFSNGVDQLIHYPKGSLFHSYFGEKQKKHIWRDIPNNIQGYPSYIESLWSTANCDEAMQVIPYIDFQLQLPEEFLLMTDRFSMAWSVEARTPLLDHRLVEHVLKIPPNIRSTQAELKKLLRSTVRDLIPESLYNAPKRGFVLPVDKWLRGKMRPLVEEYLGRDWLRAQGLFNENIYSRYVVPHMKGVKDYSWQLWTLLMFQLWFKVHGPNSIK